MTNYRRTDPQTSKEAGEMIEDTGTAQNQRDRIEWYVKEHPGLTAAEIAEAVHMERHAPSRRLPELRSDGVVISGKPRECLVTGHRSLTWWPVEKKPQPLLFGDILAKGIRKDFRDTFKSIEEKRTKERAEAKDQEREDWEAVRDLLRALPKVTNPISWKQQAKVMAIVKRRLGE